ncbi:MAG: CoA protein activase [Bacillota bacterium]
MKVTFPHMGNLHIAIKAIVQEIGAEPVVPPFISKRTVELGARYSPEFACYPLKLNLGNFLEARELGAEAVVMGGGTGPCRFGYYAQVQDKILRSLGFPLRMVVLEPPQEGWGQLWRQIRQLSPSCSYRTVMRAIALGWAKVHALDQLEAAALRCRCAEKSPGALDLALSRALDAVDRALTPKGVYQAAREGQEGLAQVTGPLDPERPRIAVVGEVYMVLEPAANLDLERRLGKLGAEVVRSIYIGEWIRANLLPRVFMPREERERVEAAHPYLAHFAGGHARETVGSTVLYSKQGIDGVIQVQPLTCMPEIVAQGVLGAVSRDHDIPVLTLSLDEHSAPTGVQTRLEAFVDMAVRRRKRRQATSSSTWE